MTINFNNYDYFFITYCKILITIRLNTTLLVYYFLSTNILRTKYLDVTKIVINKIKY